MKRAKWVKFSWRVRVPAGAILHYKNYVSIMPENESWCRDHCNGLIAATELRVIQDIITRYLYFFYYEFDGQMTSCSHSATLNFVFFINHNNFFFDILKLQFITTLYNIMMMRVVSALYIWKSLSIA